MLLGQGETPRSQQPNRQILLAVRHSTHLLVHLVSALLRGNVYSVLVTAFQEFAEARNRQAALGALA